MARRVPHHRPELGDIIKVSRPVSSWEWGGLGSLANYGMGHGGMLIPWAAISQTITSGSTYTYHFYVAPKKPAVERVWVLNMRAASATGVTAEVTAGGATMREVAVSSTRDARAASETFTEQLTAKTNTAGDTTLVVKAKGGNVVLESVSMYEQTRHDLADSTDDYGVDITTLRARQPIGDLTYQNVSGVMDAYKNLDARRAGFYHWSTDSTAALAITAGSGAPATISPLAIPINGAVPTYNDTTTTVTCAVYCKVNAGTGSIRFQSSDAAASATVTQTATSYGWKAEPLTINTEDLTKPDGMRSGTWEGVSIDAWVTATNQLDIQAISIVRTTAPI